jgi:uncharacterized damage-inducible protein DinB
MKPHFQMMAGYNRWANERLYEAAQWLPDREYRNNRGAFFGSVHGTLNHLLVTDRIWMQRLSGTGTAPQRLDEILFDDFAALQEARIAEDNRIVAYVDGLGEDEIVAGIVYRTITSPREMKQTRGSGLAHLFNHQTHHRGQAHALITQIAGNEAAPSLDLLLFQRESGIGMT